MFVRQKRTLIDWLVGAQNNLILVSKIPTSLLNFLSICHAQVTSCKQPENSIRLFACKLTVQVYRSLFVCLLTCLLAHCNPILIQSACLEHCAMSIYRELILITNEPRQANFNGLLKQRQGADKSTLTFGKVAQNMGQARANTHTQTHINCRQRANAQKRNCK